MKNMRIAELLFNRPLMISEAKLGVILHILGPRFNLDLAAMPSREAAEISDRERRRAGYEVKNGVGIIGIHGPLMHRVLASEFPSGGPSTYADIRRAFDLALVDDAVSSIAFDIDSPGGQVNGAFDLADHIYQSRGKKPITAVVNESAFSAAYLLASAADRIVVPRTGEVGSVGVIATHADFSRAEEAAGITVTHVFAGARKADFSPHKPLSEEALGGLQQGVNETYDLFVQTVARNRGISADLVRATEAGIFEGKKALSKGLADEVLPVDKAFARLQGRPTTSRIIASAGTPAHKKEHAMTLEELRADHPDLVEQIETEARQGTIAQADHEAALATARGEERAAVLGLVTAAVGEEVSTKISAAADKGLTAEDLQSLGVTFSASSSDEESRRQILAGLQGAAPEGVCGAQPESAAEADRGKAVSAMVAGGNSRRR